MARILRMARMDGNFEKKVTKGREGTTQAQRPGPRGGPNETALHWPGPLQRPVRHYFPSSEKHLTSCL